MLGAVALAVLTASGGSPIKLASPGLSLVHVEESVGAFYGDHLAQRLALEGMSVITAKEIGTLIGLERQKQLLGCTEASSSCVAEIANALGVDGVVTGSIGRFGKSLQIDIKVISTTGVQLAVHSGRVDGEEAALDELDRIARLLGDELWAKLRPGTAPPRAQASTGPTGSSGLMLGVAGGGDVLGRSVGAEVAAGYHFGALELTLRARLGAANGVGVQVAYGFDLGPVNLFAGLRGAGHPALGAVGGGVTAGLRVPVAARISGVAQVCAELFEAPSTYRSTGLILLAGIDWR